MVPVDLAKHRMMNAASDEVRRHPRVGRPLHRDEDRGEHWRPARTTKPSVRLPCGHGQLCSEGVRRQKQVERQGLQGDTSRTRSPGRKRTKSTHIAGSVPHGAALPGSIGTRTQRRQSPPPRGDGKPKAKASDEEPEQEASSGASGSSAILTGCARSVVPLKEGKSVQGDNGTVPEQVRMHSRSARERWGEQLGIHAQPTGGPAQKGAT